MLFRCCLIHISIIILRHFLYLLYLCPCLNLGLFMSYLYDLFSLFIFIFIMINWIISRIQSKFVAWKQESLMLIFFVMRKWYLKLNILKIWNSLRSTQVDLRLFFGKNLKRSIPKNCLLLMDTRLINEQKALFYWNFQKRKNWHF